MSLSRPSPTTIRPIGNHTILLAKFKNDQSIFHLGLMIVKVIQLFVTIRVRQSVLSLIELVSHESRILSIPTGLPPLALRAYYISTSLKDSPIPTQIYQSLIRLDWKTYDLCTYHHGDQLYYIRRSERPRYSACKDSPRHSSLST